MSYVNDHQLRKSCTGETEGSGRENMAVAAVIGEDVVILEHSGNLTVQWHPCKKTATRGECHIKTESEMGETHLQAKVCEEQPAAYQMLREARVPLAEGLWPAS